jgi:small subunit ribosomal protein S3
LILQPLNSNICNILNKKQQNLLKKKLIKLKKYQRNEFFKEGINLMFSAVNEKNSANLLSKFISFSLKKLKRHNFFLRFIKTALTMFMSYKTISSKIKGIKINVKGRLNRVPRAKSKMITIGNVPLLTIDSNIDYSETTSYTTNGSIGVKVWVCEKLKTKNVKWT